MPIAYCHTLENKSSFPVKPPPEEFLGAGLLCTAGALFQPPKSSSAAIVVSAGLVLLVVEPQALSRGGMVEGGATDVDAAGSGAPQTSDDPQGSKPDAAPGVAEGFAA